MSAITIKNLEAKYDRAKSFYGKAKVRTIGDTETLISYQTNVMRIQGGRLLRTPGQPQSMTTSRHMREFAQQHGYPAMSKKELMELPTK